MKKFLAIILLGLFCSSLIGCGDAVHYTDVPESYVKTLDYHDDFVIAQLTDIHWSNATYIGDDENGSVAYIKQVINTISDKFGGIDLIEITGDTFCLADPRAVRSFIGMMEEIGIPYAITWGNHDRQSKYNPNWLSKQFLNAPYSLYTEVDNDDVHERGNYVVELVEGDNTVWQIFNIDSGSSYRNGAADIGLEYDYVRDDQIEWFEYMHERAGSEVPVICYYHIPQKEFVEAHEAISAGDPSYKSKFYKFEGISNSPYAKSLNPVFVKNNVKGAFIGHDHSDDWTFTNPDGIVYGYGVKTGIELYSTDVNSENAEIDKPINGEITDEFDLLGASVVNLKNKSGDFDLYHLYLIPEENGFDEMWEEY